MFTDNCENVRLCGIVPPCKKSPNNGPFMMLFAVVADGLWENGTVLNYSFYGGTAQQQRKVDTVIKEWTWYAHITFNRVTDNDPSATLRITFNLGGGSWSYVGRAVLACIAPEPTINFGWVEDTPDTTKRERGVILHEFGHVLGLIHEHESPARSGILRLKEKQIVEHYKEKMNWDEATVHNQVLDVYSVDAVTNYSRFDPSSIMVYAMPALMNEGGIEIHEVTELSSFDKAFIVANYPRPEVHQCAKEWNPRYALLVAGASAHAIKAYLAAPDIHAKREIFTQDMRARRRLEAEWMKQHEPGIVQQPHKLQRMLDPSGVPLPKTPNPAPTDPLARLAAAVVAHPNLKLIIDSAVSAMAENYIDVVPHTQDMAKMQFRKRADTTMTRMWENVGPQGSEKVLKTIERCLVE